MWVGVFVLYLVTDTVCLFNWFVVFIDGLLTCLLWLIWLFGLYLIWFVLCLLTCCCLIAFDYLFVGQFVFIVTCWLVDLDFVGFACYLGLFGFILANYVCCYLVIVLLTCCLIGLILGYLLWCLRVLCGCVLDELYYDAFC